MARILCSLSGIEYKTQLFQFYSCAQESHHPIFDLSVQKLTQIYTDSYIEDKLLPDESYLLYLSLWRATNLIDFRVAAQRTIHTPAIIATTIHSLIQMVTRIDTWGSEKISTILQLPSYVVNTETRDLSSCSDWLAIWQANYSDYQQGYKTTTMVAKISALEALLEANIKNRLKDISSYSTQLANWAEAAGSFPTYTVLDQNDIPVAMNEYWKRIIKLATKGESIYSVPDIDLTDLIEHCEETIPHGTIQAATLMALLRSAQKKRTALQTLGDIDLDVTFKILRPDAGVEEANMLALILSAPKQEPKESDYPNKLAYVRAKMKWGQAETYYRDHPEERPAP